MSKPTVSVCMITYGHEKFISEAIEGVLMQECDFEIELVIADDCSPDNTEEVVRHYIEHHPRGSWIKYTRHERNMGMSSNFVWALQSCQGKYIAFCEGDDYWTDPLKLQKQVDFLEANQEYGLSFTQARVYHESKGKMSEQTDYQINSLDDFLTGKTAITCTSVFLADKIKNFHEFCITQGIEVIDISLWLFLTISQGVKVLPDCTSVYRITGESVSNHHNFPNRLKFLERPFLIRKKVASSAGRYELVYELEKRYFETLISTCVKFMEIQHLQKICDKASASGFKVPLIVKLLKSSSVFPLFFIMLRFLILKFLTRPFALENA